MKFLGKMPKLKLDGKLKKYLPIVAGGLVLVVLLVVFIVSCSRTRVYRIAEMDDFKLTLINIAKAHMEANPDLLPNENERFILSIDALVYSERIPPLYEILENGENCAADIRINNNRGHFLYVPMIYCGELYRSETLAQLLLDENNIVTSGNGLYEIGDNFVFRGDNVNNYIQFAGRLWVILRINADHTMKILEVPRRSSVVWDNRINPDRNQSVGINSFIRNDINSRIKDSLIRIYQDEFTNANRAHMVPQTLCVGGRSLTDGGTDGAIECAITLENQVLGLPAIYEFMQASLSNNCVITRDRACQNYNFMATLTPTFWSLTPDRETSFRVFRINRRPDLANASSFATIKATALLHADLLLSDGDGSEDNPFTLLTSS